MLPVVRGPGATGSVEPAAVPQGLGGARAEMGVGRDCGGGDVLLRLALPLHRGLEERVARRHGRAARAGALAGAAHPARQDRGHGQEPGPGSSVAGAVQALPVPRAGVGGALLRGRALLSLLRRTPHPQGLGCQASVGRPRAHRRLCARCPWPSSVLPLAAFERLAGPGHSGPGHHRSVKRMGPVPSP